MNQNVGQFRGGERDVERGQPRPRFKHAVIGFEKPVAVHAEKCDAIAWFDAGFAQSTGEPAGTLRKLRVSKAMLAAHNGCAARVLLLRVAQATDWSEGNVHRFSRAIKRSALHPRPTHGQ